MRFDKSSVGRPHDLLQLPELAKKTRIAVVDLFGSLSKLRVDVGLDIPDTVGESAALGAGDFLLLETPVGKFDLVGEEGAAGHDVNQLELGLDRSKALLGILAVRHLLNNLHTEEIVGVSFKSGISICRDLILPLGLTNWWTDIMRVHAAVGVDMIQTDDAAVNNPFWVVVVPCERACNAGVSRRIDSPVDWLSLVLSDEDVVLVLVGIEGDLLLLASCRVHVCMRVEVSSLGVVMAQTDARAKSHICGHICHSLGVEGGLEFAAHETIAVTRVDQTDEMDREHGHVEGDGDDDQAEDASEEVFEPDAGGDILGVSEEDPQLEDGERPDPGDGEETDPFDTGGGTKGETSRSQPEPPAGFECVFGSEFVLVDEGEPGQAGQCGEDDQWGVQEDQSGLSDESILKGEQSRTQSGGRRPAAHGFQGEIHGGDGENTQESGQQTHCDVRDLGFEVVLANVLEIKVAIETRQPAGEGDEQFGEGRVDIHEEAALDVFAGEPTEVNLIEDDAGGLVDAEESHEEGEQGDSTQHLPVGASQVEDVVVFYSDRGIVGRVVRVRRLVAGGLGEIRGSIAANAGDGRRAR